MYQICKDRHPPAMPENLTEDARSFLHACWQWDPRHRPNCDRLLMHPFIKSASDAIAIGIGGRARPMHPAVGAMPSPVQEEATSQDGQRLTPQPNEASRARHRITFPILLLQACPTHLDAMSLKRVYGSNARVSDDHSM